MYLVLNQPCSPSPTQASPGSIWPAACRLGDEPPQGRCCFSPFAKDQLKYGCAFFEGITLVVCRTCGCSPTASSTRLQRCLQPAGFLEGAEDAKGTQCAAFVAPTPQLLDGQPRRQSFKARMQVPCPVSNKGIKATRIDTLR